MTNVAIWYASSVSRVTHWLREKCLKNSQKFIGAVNPTFVFPLLPTRPRREDSRAQETRDTHAILTSHQLRHKLLETFLRHVLDGVIAIAGLSTTWIRRELVQTTFVEMSMVSTFAKSSRSVHRPCNVKIVSTNLRTVSRWNERNPPPLPIPAI